MPLPRGKLAKSLAGRGAATARWIEWASINRTNRPLIWVHGASVGEILSAAPVVARLRAAVSNLQVVHSYTSPSASSWHATFGGDRADYLPAENRDSIGRVLESVRPDLVVFSRGDVWPTMVQTAALVGIPIAVIAGTVTPSSRRMWPLVRRVLTPTYQSINWLGAVSRADANRWISLGMSAHSTEVTGDPRHDQVLERQTNLSAIAPLLQWSNESPALVAGSTDKRDERVLLETFARIVHTSDCSTRLMIVPHDVAQSRIDHVKNVANRYKIPADIWNGGSPSPRVQCVIVEKMGVLADLYALGQIAYVGGGFGRGGLHAVVEPAAFAVPIIVGPEHSRSPDFRLLSEAKGAMALPRRGAAEELRHTWTEWATNARIRMETGLRARGVLHHQGAATTSTLALLRLMGHSAT